MPDVYKRRFAIKGTKKDVMKALRFMAEQAALKTEYSYLYEMFLKPTEVGIIDRPTLFFNIKSSKKAVGITELSPALIGQYTIPLRTGTFASLIIIRQ